MSYLHEDIRYVYKVVYRIPDLQDEIDREDLEFLKELLEEEKARLIEDGIIQCSILLETLPFNWRLLAAKALLLLDNNVGDNTPDNPASVQKSEGEFKEAYELLTQAIEINPIEDSIKSLRVWCTVKHQQMQWRLNPSIYSDACSTEV